MKRATVALLACLVAGCGASSTAAGPSSTRAGATPPGLAATTEPTAATGPTFKEISLSGRGKKVVKFSIPEDAAAIATITHKGSANFIVHTLDSGGADIDFLVNEIGSYAGTVLLDPSGGHPVAFKVDADSTWTIKVRPITAAPTWNPSSALKGKGDAVYLISPQPTGLTIIKLTYKGESNFIVHAWSEAGRESLANEIGTFSGETNLPEGSLVLEVLAAGGTWTVSTSS